MAPVLVPVIDPVEYLVEQRFPSYHAKLQSFVRSDSPPKGLSHGEREALEESIEQYRRELMSKSEEQIQALFEHAVAERAAERRLRAEQADQSLFFNRPEAMARFDLWAAKPVWTLEEGTALVFGRCPAQVTWEKLRRHALSPFVQRYGDLRDTVLRAHAVKLLLELVPPGAFLAFARRAGCEPPRELIDAVRARGMEIADWKTRHDELRARNMTLERECDRLKQLNLELQAQVAATDSRVKELEEQTAAWQFDEAMPTYPRELDAAMQAWWAISRRVDPPTNPGDELKAWLRAYKPPRPDTRPFSEDACRRIAIVCNWNKVGGRAKLPEKGPGG